MVAMQGEQLGVVTNWPPSLEAALQRWGTISPKAPCLTTMDTNGKPLYVLTYGKQSLGSHQSGWETMRGHCGSGTRFFYEIEEKHFSAKKSIDIYLYIVSL